MLALTLITLYISICFKPVLSKMSYFFRCVRCDLNFDTENEFNNHASATNTSAKGQASAGEIDQVPQWVSPCVARVVCRKCYRSYKQIRIYKGGSESSAALLLFCGSVGVFDCLCWFSTCSLRKILIIVLLSDQ